VDAQASLTRGSDDRAELADWPRGASSAIVGVFDREQLRSGILVAVGPDRLGQLLHGNQAALADERPRLSSPKRRDAASLIVNDMAAGFGDHLVARSTKQSNRNLVGLGAGSDEKARRMTQKFGGAFLQPAHRGIFAVGIIANRRFGHRPAHPGAGLSNGIGSKIEQSH